MTKKEIIDIKDIDRTNKKQKIKDFPNDNRTIEQYLKDRLDKTKTEGNIKIPKIILDNLPSKDWIALQEYIIKKNIKEIIEKSIMEVEKVIEKEPEPDIDIVNNRNNNYNDDDLYDVDDSEIKKKYYYDNSFYTEVFKLSEIYYMIHYRALKNALKMAEVEKQEIN